MILSLTLHPLLWLWMQKKKNILKQEKLWKKLFLPVPCLNKDSLMIRQQYYPVDWLWLLLPLSKVFNTQKLLSTLEIQSKIFLKTLMLPLNRSRTVKKSISLSLLLLRKLSPKETEKQEKMLIEDPNKTSFKEILNSKISTFKNIYNIKRKWQNFKSSLKLQDTGISI